MKKIFLYFTFLLLQNTFAQNFHLKIKGQNNTETKTIDSIGYVNTFEKVSEIVEYKKSFENKLTLLGFYQKELLEQQKVNDSSFLLVYQLGKAITEININFNTLSDNEKELIHETSDTITIPTSEIENWMNGKLALLEKNGYALAKLQLQNVLSRKNILQATLFFSAGSKRTFNELVIIGYDKFPENIKRNWNKKLKKRDFNQELVEEIYNDFSEFPFVNQIKYPEILLTQDSTKVYAYVEKSRPNKFDGFIGFANDAEKSKIVFNGYLDLALQNIFNSGEKFNIYWRNDGNQQTSFNLGTELPYAFKTAFGLKGNLKIFKQDSTFQNTNLDLNVGYYFSYNKKAFLGYQSTNSVDIQNSNSASLQDFNSKFYTLSFEYIKRDKNSVLFPEKTNFFLKTGIGNRTLTAETTHQILGQMEISHNLYINEKNSINVKNQTFYLDSNNYVVNELFRFGGINSIRGFRENTLQASLFSGIFTEYRYILASNLFVNSIIDYGYMQDKTADIQENLLGLGFGFGLASPNGLFSLVYANGSTKEQTIKLSNSIVHISFKTNF
ncbi:hypothetical protein NHF50_04420 [Flavobacterium sp. NRK F10]|uniref:hypothetical protein n=1 Tax=Flavobacterium sp. NRK F10 TaxID=2954931 RepID=UPI002091926A|nr:hypothetical protein [Flavobacterium sp. NRK F10]MCO6174282.1 hypothetical protein [Flavobacterium sp. NRK F10]